MNNEVFLETKRCEKVWKRNDWGIHCHDCSLNVMCIICSDCFEKSRHTGHEFETVVCESGVWCDCGNTGAMKSQGFCFKHTVHLAGNMFVRVRNRSFKSSSTDSHRKISDFLGGRRGSEGFLDGILHHLFAIKPLDLHEFYDLTKVSKYSSDGTLISKYFHRSRAHYLEEGLRLKRIYEINKLLDDSHPQTKKRMLLWYSVDTTHKGDQCLAKLLQNGIGYTNGKMGRAVYLRDRINRFVKYGDKQFGLLLLCQVTVGNVYRIYKRKHLVEVPVGYDSIKCCGKFKPDSTKHKTIGRSGVVVPTGKTIVDQTLEDRTDFDINQYIVFDKSQVIVKYIVQYYEQQK